MEILVDGRLEKFIDSLSEEPRVRVTYTIGLLKMMGNKLGMPHSKRINKRLFELRVIGKPSIRILYEFKSRKAYLIHGFIKKSQKTPRKEIDTALKRVFN